MRCRCLTRSYTLDNNFVRTFSQPGQKLKTVYYTNPAQDNLSIAGDNAAPTILRDVTRYMFRSPSPPSTIIYASLSRPRVLFGAPPSKNARGGGVQNVVNDTVEGRVFMLSITSSLVHSWPQTAPPLCNCGSPFRLSSPGAVTSYEWPRCWFCLTSIVYPLLSTVWKTILRHKHCPGCLGKQTNKLRGLICRNFAHIPAHNFQRSSFTLVYTSLLSIVQPWHCEVRTQFTPVFPNLRPRGSGLGNY